MNEAAKKGATQAAILIGLMLVLGFLMFRMVSSMQGGNKKSAARKPAAQKTAQATKPDPDDAPSSTNMPVVPRTGDNADKGMEIGESDLHLNPNQFRVYALNPPKNPFVQSERWYSDELKKLPGYPQLKDSDYFNTTDAYLPDIPLINQEEWETIQVQKSPKEDSYEITGTSDDGEITTTIRMTPRTPPGQSLNWSRATGVPVSALKSPSWRDRYGDQLSGTLLAKKDDSGFVADALGIPGDTGGSRSTAEVLDGESGSGNGDALFAVGVSLHGKQASALIRHNGKTRIVREGSVIPTHFQVLTIKANGIVVVDLRDGSSNWLPLGAAPAEKNTNKKPKVKAA